MWELTIKKAECPRIDAFELWCWRRLLRVPWTARRSNQSILKEISSGCSLEGLMLKLKLQIFGHLMWRADSLEKTWLWERLKGGEGDDRGWDGWMASLTWWTWVWVNSGNWWWTGVLQSMGSQRVRHNWATELNSTAVPGSQYPKPRICFPGELVGKEFACNAVDARNMGLILGSGRSLGGETGIPLQYWCLENPTDRGAWQATVHGVTNT